MVTYGCKHNIIGFCTECNRIARLEFLERDRDEWQARAEEALQNIHKTSREVVSLVLSSLREMRNHAVEVANQKVGISGNAYEQGRISMADDMIAFVEQREAETEAEYRAILAAKLGVK